DKFVTFPHCAGCGAHLPQVAPQTVGFWRRPVRAPMWATVIGLCCVALGVLGLAVTRETRRVEEKPLVVYAAVPRRISLGQNAVVRLQLDTVEGDSGASSAPFEAVRLRLPGQTFRDFAVLSISPPPVSRSIAGSGRYFMWDELSLEQPISLLVRPRRSGELRLGLMLSARDFSPFEMRRSVTVVRTVTRRTAPVVPNSPHLSQGGK
ncbi:MAG: hypothetical protein KY445_00375, partial [Armatimonadetes bacterium]|nr:hypothetical protein [Armatimonadota bacterium]